MTKVAENIESINADIRRFEAEYGRSSNSVTLLAVSKRHHVEKIRLAAEQGIRNFGENYLQEALGKIEALAHLQLIWHFIGPIQSNKTKGIAENFDWVHSIDRAKIAKRLNEQRPAEIEPLNVCVQVNLSNEMTKSGIDIQDTAKICAEIADLPNLNLRGLMAIPAPIHEFQDQREKFRELAQVFQSLSKCHPGMDTLSMGMSNDFQAAIAEGSTMIRLGTALFGERSD